MSNNPRNIPEAGTPLSTVVPSKRAKVTKDQMVLDPDTEDNVPTPPVFTRKLRKAAVGTGCDIRLRVSVSGNPAPSLSWYHNEEPLAQSKDHDTGGLWIRDCKPSDAGLYTCLASNSLGDTRSSALLAVMDLGNGVQRRGSRGVYNTPLEIDLDLGLVGVVFESGVTRREKEHEKERKGLREFCAMAAILRKMT
ncbi:hypothetical protein DPEC_G00155650 [Dallia pectoralis]|uniref:Uncharacterized protein n=1 Tax=Dallia pectoralis TaxID=75939 RepID=A0ACC2GKP9_DALPE|nr:hypothetical protein DPEC_G00155650 [Dallia pectoralis]